MQPIPAAGIHQTKAPRSGPVPVAAGIAELGLDLQPGLTVLDVGCGDGALTAEIAQAVGPVAKVVGVELDSHCVEEARARYGDIMNLAFEQGDLRGLDGTAKFDVVLARRVLHDLVDAPEAVRRLAANLRPGGLLVAIDDDLSAVAQASGDLPPALWRFFQGFLDWRASHGLHNGVAQCLSTWFQNAGLVNVEERESVRELPRREHESPCSCGLWWRALHVRGPVMVNSGVITPDVLVAAQESYQQWLASGTTPRLRVVTVHGRMPA